MKAKGWTCQRQTKGVVCKHHNLPRTRKCAECGKPRPAKKRPEHIKALDLDYQGFIALNGGEFCRICGRKPTFKRKLDRDHDHKNHLPRGLLCSRCNRALPVWITPEWLRAAAKYLERVTNHKSMV